MITKTDEIIWRVVDDEALILNTSNGYYFSMNGTATEAWCLLNEGKSIDEVAATIADRYAIDLSSAKADVESLLTELKNEKIVE
ncbi:MAG TPA: PqqD family protein [Drouetiella sp.]|jgi:Coenzyme PQQ synthesis protein D (PqqD)